LNERSARIALSLAFLAPDIVNAAVSATLLRRLGGVVSRRRFVCNAVITKKSSKGFCVRARQEARSPCGLSGSSRGLR
jgi:hypothetical protein